MISIDKATSADLQILETVGKQSFYESHGHSAAQEDIDAYVAGNYTVSFFEKEIRDSNNIYHIIRFNSEPAGYSKIILNKSHPNVPAEPVTKLERIYVLQSFFDKQLGSTLFEFNKQISVSNNQKGIWLFVWKENARAIRFYEKKGFKVVGAHDFRISETHSNPNHVMFLEF